MREQSINDIINDKSMKISLKRNLNDNIEINDKKTRRKTAPKVAYTEYVADKLVKIFNAPRSRNFFLKCAWNLSEDTIWSAVEDSRKKSVKTPIALFVFLCNNALKELPVKS